MIVGEVAVDMTDVVRVAGLHCERPLRAGSEGAPGLLQPSEGVGVLLVASHCLP